MTRELVIAHSPELGEESNQGCIEDFEGSETTLYDAIIVDACQYTLVQIYRRHTTKNEPQCKL
jgi:hypothetical protein